MSWRVPHPLSLLLVCLFAAALGTHLLPAGSFDRREDPATGRGVVVAGTYHRVEPNPVGAFGALEAIPRGLEEAGSVVFLVFLVGGAFTVVDETGALRQAVSWLVRRIGSREIVVVPIVSLAFGLGGVLENMSEEIVALVPVLLILTRRLGFDALTAVAMSLGAAAVGAAFSPVNPFQVQIAQKLAGLPLLSGGLYRTAVLAAAMAVWIAVVWRHARATRTTTANVSVEEGGPLDARRAAVLAIVFAAFGAFVFGILQLGWDFDQMSALFFAMGLIAGIVGGLGTDGTARAFATGFGSMAYAGMLIGFARAIFVVLTEGRVIDTVVYGLTTPLQALPVAACALAMQATQAALHVVVPSVSGQAVLTMPVLVPMSDLIGLSRQVTVLAYQYGGGLVDLVTPTNGALMAVVAAAGVRYEDWLAFALPAFLGLLALGAVAILAAIGLGV
jgi:uncharacterized ion transporter superfamily protein YfcC